MKITYSEIAPLINKTEQGVKYYKAHNPQLLEILQLGGLMKKYNINKNDLMEYLELNNLLKDTGICKEQLKGLLLAVKRCKNDK